MLTLRIASVHNYHYCIVQSFTAGGKCYQSVPCSTQFCFCRSTLRDCKEGGSYVQDIILLDNTNDLFRVVVGATIVSVCHALLRIRSLSATLHVDPAWLLNHAELSRVQWTKGDREGEIFVELQDSSCAELPMANMSRTIAPDIMQSSDPGIIIRSN
jgi:hypothetical protein